MNTRKETINEKNEALTYEELAELCKKQEEHIKELYLTTIWVLYARFKEPQATVDVLCKENSELKKKYYSLEEHKKDNEEQNK